MSIKNKKIIDDLLSKLLDFYTENKDELIKNLSLYDSKYEVEYISKYFYFEQKYNIRWLFEYLIRVNNKISHDIFKSFFEYDDLDILEKTHLYFDRLIESRREDIILFLLNSSNEKNILFAIEKSKNINLSKLLNEFLDTIEKAKNLNNEKILIGILEIIENFNNKRISKFLADLVLIYNDNFDSSVKTIIREKVLHQYSKYPENSLKYISKFIESKDKDIKVLGYTVILLLRGKILEKYILNILKNEKDIDLLCFIISKIKYIDTKKIFDEIWDILIKTENEILENSIVKFLNKTKNNKIFEWIISLNCEPLKIRKKIIFWKILSNYKNKYVAQLLKNIFIESNDWYVKVKILEFMLNENIVFLKDFFINIFEQNNELSYIATIALLEKIDEEIINIFFESKQIYKIKIILSFLLNLNNKKFFEIAEKNKNILQNIFRYSKNENLSIKFLADSCVKKFDLKGCF